MKRNILALVLVSALALSVCGTSASAIHDQAGKFSAMVAGQNAADQAGQEDVQQPETPDASAPDGTEATTPDSEDAPAAEEPADLYVPDPVGTLSFANLEGRLREHNYNLLALDETIASVEVLDYDKMQEDLRKALNKIADAQWMLSIAGQSFAASSLSQSYDSLRDTFDDLKDGKIQDDNNAILRQLRNAQDQVVMAAESLYVALVEMEQQDKALDRQLTALDRTLEELNLRYDLGQISALTLQQAKAGRTALVSGQQTLKMNIEAYKLQLEMMIGAELTGGIQLQALPQVTAQQLTNMDLEADLADARETSYELFSAQKTLADAKEDYQDAAKEHGYYNQSYEFASAKHTWQAAQHTFTATDQGFDLKFRTLYAQVKDYKQVLDAANTALALEQANYAAAQLKYEQGTLSQNKLLEAADSLTAAQEKVDGAAIDLFAAYHNYRWAVDYGMLN